MNFSYFVASRFFTTTKKWNFVHVISWVSLLGVAIGTAALILVLSVFNGFESLVLSMYNSFDPHLTISSSKGKTFNPELMPSEILDNDNIYAAAFVLEEKALLKYQDKQFIATIKGVSSNYHNITSFDSLLIEGEYFHDYENKNVGIIGAGISYHLSMGLASVFEQLHVYLPNRKSKTLLNTYNTFRQASLTPTGVFSIQAEIDEKYIVTPLRFIQELSENNDQISAIEIKLRDYDNMLLTQEELQQSLSSDYIVKNRLEHQVVLYKILNTEKLAVFLILLFILIIATFNIIGSLTMLIIDKKEKVLSLISFGANKQNIKHIFFYTSMMIVGTGAIIGLAIGLFLGFIQQKFGFISLGGGFVIDAYPIIFSIFDIIVVLCSVLIIGLVASWFPSHILINRIFKRQIH